MKKDVMCGGMVMGEGVHCGDGRWYLGRVVTLKFSVLR